MPHISTDTIALSSTVLFIGINPVWIQTPNTMNSRFYGTVRAILHQHSLSKTPLKSCPFIQPEQLFSILALCKYSLPAFLSSCQIFSHPALTLFFMLSSLASLGHHVNVQGETHGARSRFNPFCLCALIGGRTGLLLISSPLRKVSLICSVSAKRIFSTWFRIPRKNTDTRMYQVCFT